MYKCLYNIELLIIGTAKTPFQGYDEPIKPETVAEYVKQLRQSDVDAVMLCPTAWKLPLWRSKVYPFWENEARSVREPYFFEDLKYYEKVFYRFREFMKGGNDPLRVAVEEANKSGIAPFVSYRMNDHHFTDNPEAPVHPAFWRENRHLWVSDEDRYLNYLEPEVRKFYFDILTELVENYEVSGIELDFMRYPVFFPKDSITEGLSVMTEFVREVRLMLDETGKKKGRKLSLCVRVPRNVEVCLEAGLDVPRWDREGLVDMINVSPYFISSPNLDIDGFNKAAPNAKKYGEMHFIVKSGVLKSGYRNNVNRKTTRQMYRAMAASYLDRGFDGVSFFNFDYARHHFFGDGRRMYEKIEEPPHDVLSGITSLDFLNGKDKHYFVGTSYSIFPRKNEFELSLYLAEKNAKEDFRHAILRLETAEYSQGAELDVKVNGVKVSPIIWSGELFPPQSTVALPDADNVHTFFVPTEILLHGYNEIVVENVSETVVYKPATFEALELALYKNNTLLEK